MSLSSAVHGILFLAGLVSPVSLEKTHQKQTRATGGRSFSFIFFLLYLSLYFLTQLLIATNRIPKRKKNYWNIYVQAARIICTSDVQFYVSIPCFMWCWIVQDLPLLLQLVSCFISQSLCMFLPCMTFYFNSIRSLKNVFTVKLKDQQFVSLVSRFGAVVEDLQWIKGM